MLNSFRLKRDSSSVVERQIEDLRVGGAIPSYRTILLSGDQGERVRLLSGIKSGSIPETAAKYYLLKDNSIKELSEEEFLTYNIYKIPIGTRIMTKQYAEYHKFIPASSKGRTSEFDSDNCGSNP